MTNNLTIPVGANCSYAGMEALLYSKDQQWRTHRRVGRNTTLYRSNEGISLYFHDSRLLQWTRDNMLVIDGNDYYTQATRELFNTWLPFGLTLDHHRPTDANDVYWRIGGLLDVQNKTYTASAFFHQDMQIDLDTLTEFTAPFNLTTSWLGWNALVIEIISTRCFSGYCSMCKKFMNVLPERAQIGSPYSRALLRDFSGQKNDCRADGMHSVAAEKYREFCYGILLAGPHTLRGGRPFKYGVLVDTNTFYPQVRPV